MRYSKPLGLSTRPRSKRTCYACAIFHAYRSPLRYHSVTGLVKAVWSGILKYPQGRFLCRGEPGTRNRSPFQGTDVPGQIGSPVQLSRARIGGIEPNRTARGFGDLRLATSIRTPSRRKGPAIVAYSGGRYNSTVEVPEVCGKLLVVSLNVQSLDL